MKLTESDILAKIKQLALSNQYRLTHHARQQMIDRNMTIDDVHDILTTCNTILRPDKNKHRDGIPSYKIKGGENDDRLAVKFEMSTTNEIIVIITVMDNQVKK